MRVTWPALALLIASGCSFGERHPGSEPALPIEPEKRSQNAVFQGALMQLQKPAVYDASYKKIGFPDGDVDLSRGACADVVVRALRHAGVDLQKEINTDAKVTSYPGITKLDTNIDHRRVVNQEQWLAKHADVLGDKDWMAGDIVSWRLPSGRAHIGIVSDYPTGSSTPFVIHNIWKVAEEDVLHKWKVFGHYRLKLVPAKR